jgi:hypothetical protein
MLCVRINKTSLCLEQVSKIPGVYFSAVVYKITSIYIKKQGI